MSRCVNGHHHVQCFTGSVVPPIQELSFVPVGIRKRPYAACDTNDVDATWQIWSKVAEDPSACWAEQLRK